MFAHLHENFKKVERQVGIELTSSESEHVPCRFGEVPGAIVNSLCTQRIKGVGDHCHLAAQAELPAAGHARVTLQIEAHVVLEGGDDGHPGDIGLIEEIL